MSNPTFDGLIAYLNGINQEEKQKIASLVSGIHADPVKRRISIKEYSTLLETNLCEENLMSFLQITRCSHLFKLLYPNALESMSEADAKLLEFEEGETLVGSSDGESSGGESGWGFFRDDLLRILDTINVQNKNPVRLKFLTFLDLCWEAVAFDVWGKGNIDQVFDARTDAEFSTENQLKPWDVRKTFLYYIQLYLCKQKENEALNDQNFVKALGVAFTSTINTLNSFDKII